MTDDRDILRAMHRGDHAAALDLWQRFAPILFAYISTIVPPHTTHDLVQTTMLRALEATPQQIYSVENVKAWLLTLARHAAIDLLRARHRSDSCILRAARLRRRDSSQPPDPRDDGLAQAVDSLPRRYREAIVLRHIAGLTFDQMATALAAPRATVAARYRRALALLVHHNHEPAQAITLDITPPSPPPTQRDQPPAATINRPLTSTRAARLPRSSPFTA